MVKIKIWNFFDVYYVFFNLLPSAKLGVKDQHDDLKTAKIRVVVLNSGHIYEPPPPPHTHTHTDACVSRAVVHTHRVTYTAPHLHAHINLSARPFVLFIFPSDKDKLIFKKTTTWTKFFFCKRGGQGTYCLDSLLADTVKCRKAI